MAPQKKDLGGSSGDTVKCQYLIQSNPLYFEVTLKIWKEETGNINKRVANLANAKDILLCNAVSNQDCPKKKQPCEINSRCWRLGEKDELKKALELDVGETIKGKHGLIIRMA